MIKWLVRIGSVVGLLLIAFVGVMVLLGGGRKLVYTQASIELARSAGVVYPYLTTGPLLMKWVSGMESFQSSEELRVGQRAQVVMSIGGHRHEVTSEVLAMDPPKSFQVRIEHAEFVDTIDYLLSEQQGPHGTVTTLTQRSSSQYKDLTIRLLTPLFQRDVERAMNENLATLKGLLEREPEVRAPHPMPGQTGFHGCCAPALPSQ